MGFGISRSPSLFHLRHQFPLFIYAISNDRRHLMRLQRVDGRGFEDQGDLVLCPVGIGNHLIGVTDVGLAELFAPGEFGLEDFVEQVTLEDRDVEAAPGVGLARLEGF